MLNGQILRPDFVRGADQHGALDGIAQFADISGPVIGQQQLLSIGRNALHVLAEFAVEMPHEVLGDFDNVAARDRAAAADES